jgi:DNA-directed RNA polymerase specialized sigma24 family protein
MQEFSGMQEQTLGKRTASKKAGPARGTDPVVRITTAFAELEEEHRIVLCLHYLEKLSLEQIAQVLDDTEESVRAVYTEAVARLGKRAPKRRRTRAA